METYDKLLASGRDEFKEKGFNRASIRSISARAGLTIGSLYHYFSSKEDLYNTIIGPVAEGFLDLAHAKKEEFVAILDQDDIDQASLFIRHIAESFVSYKDENWEGFIILVSNKETSLYKDFFNRVSGIESEMSILLVEAIKGQSLDENSSQVIDLIVRSQYSTIFSILASSRNKEETQARLDIIFKFNQYGWDGLIKDRSFPFDL